MPPFLPEHNPVREHDWRTWLEHFARSPVTQMTSLQDGMVNEKYVVDYLDGTSVILRIAPPDQGLNSFDREVWAFDALAKRGLPVPKVLHADVSGALMGRPFLILTRLPGTCAATLCGSAEEKTLRFFQIGRLIRAVHDLTLDGSGLLSCARQAARGAHIDEYSYLLSQLADPRVPRLLIPSGCVSYDDIRFVAQRIDDQPKLYRQRRGCLVHNDLHLGNILIDPATDEICGIVDFELCGVGHHLFDFRCAYDLLEPGQPNFWAMRRGYGLPPMLSSEEKERLSTYKFCFTLWSLCFAFERGYVHDAQLWTREIQLALKLLKDRSSAD